MDISEFESVDIEEKDGGGLLISLVLAVAVMLPLDCTIPADKDVDKMDGVDSMNSVKSIPITVFDGEYPWLTYYDKKA